MLVHSTHNIVDAPRRWPSPVKRGEQSPDRQCLKHSLLVQSSALHHEPGPAFRTENNPADDHNFRTPHLEEMQESNYANRSTSGFDRNSANTMATGLDSSAFPSSRCSYLQMTNVCESYASRAGPCMASPGEQVVAVVSGQDVGNGKGVPPLTAYECEALAEGPEQSYRGELPGDSGKEHLHRNRSRASAEGHLWCLARDVAPQQHVLPAFSSFIPTVVHTSPTDEEAQCTTCGYFIDLTTGAVFDSLRASHCWRCAIRSGLMQQLPLQRQCGNKRSASTAMGKNGARASKRIAMRDLASAMVHLQRVLRQGGIQAQKLLKGMAEEGLELVDVAGRGVLVAFDEAVQLLREGCTLTGEPSSNIIFSLLERWEAELPTGLLAACLPGCTPARALGLSILELRAQYQDIYSIDGIKVG